jgi:hypothetical protein
VPAPTQSEPAKMPNPVAEASNRSTQALLEELRTLVDELAVTEEVVAAILPNGKPHEFESALWDYKEELPILPVQPTEEHQRQYRAKIGDIIKDVVAFHNCYGGYIVFGVADKGSDRIRGCDTQLDCGDFNRRLESYTGFNIECLFRTMPISREPRPRAWASF